MINATTLRLSTVYRISLNIFEFSNPFYNEIWKTKKKNNIIKLRTVVREGKELVGKLEKGKKLLLFHISKILYNIIYRLCFLSLILKIFINNFI